MDETEAIEQARKAVGIDGAVRAECHRVRRLDRSDEYYYLIVFGEPHATLAVAAVNAATGDVENWARSGGHRAHLSTDASAARRLAALDESAHAELVWQPGPQTRSPLYPLWEVRGLAGRTRYVDQQGNVT